MTVLVPVRYPLSDPNRLAIERGLELVADEPNPEVLVVHVNLLQDGVRATRDDLREAVEAEFGEIPAHYVVRDGFLYEEAVLDEAVRHRADGIVLSERRRGAWERLLRERLDLGVELEPFLREQLDAEIYVVGDGT